MERVLQRETLADYMKNQKCPKCNSDDIDLNVNIHAVKSYQNGKEQNTNIDGIDLVAMKCNECKHTIH